MTLERPRIGTSSPGLRVLAVALVSLTAFAGSFAGMASAEPAAPAGSPPETGSGASSPQELLARAVRAARELPYSGVQYIVACPGSGATSVVVDVAHVPGQGSQIHVRETPDAPGARVFDADGAPVDDAVGITTLDAGALGVLARRYRLTVDGQDTVAGRRADVVSARRSDGSVAGRFWIDRATGLLLSREVLDRDGRLARASAFVDLAVGKQASSRLQGTAPPTDAVPAPWGRHVGLDGAAELVRAGWHVPTQIAGGGSGVGMELFDIRLGSDRDGDGEVLHLSYTDGLSTLSVFEQRGHLDDAGMPGWQPTSMGGARVWTTGTAPEQVVWSGHRMVYTVLADATPEQLRSAVVSLPHGTADRDLVSRLLHRIGHGLKKIGSWLNPFD